LFMSVPLLRGPSVLYCAIVARGLPWGPPLRKSSLGVQAEWPTFTAGMFDR
jgi:hypothetical protein